MSKDTLLDTTETEPAAPTRKKATAAKARTAKKAAVKKAKVTEEPTPAEVAPAEEPAAKPAKAAKKAATKRAKKVAEAPTAESPVSAESVVSAPPAIPEPPPIPDIFPTTVEDSAEAAEAIIMEVFQGSSGARPAQPVIDPLDPTLRTAVSEAPAPSGPADANGNRPKLTRRQRWREKMRQKYLNRMAAKGVPVEGAEPTESEESAKGEQAPELQGPAEQIEGLLEFTPKGYGFLRLREKLYAALTTDCWVSGELIRKYGLREGMSIKGEQRQGARGPQLTEITEINGRGPDELKDLPLFEELKATNPSKRYQLETKADRMTTRVIDMMTPVGRGQRGLIVAPPRAGKTTLLQHIAEAITENYPQVHLMILLVDERPEEVTEFRRVLANAEIFASSNDQDNKSHTRISQFAIERAKRLVEQGDHVFILMDSITRLARAFNNAQKGGATMSGGMGVGAMEIPRRLFAAARNTKTAGSLTVLATALIETGSRMDDLIFQEFKGTGNMELVLDRKIAEQYIYPAVNIFKSGTRREELLLQGFQIEKIHFLRRGLAGHKPIEAIQRVLSLLEKYPTNSQMLVELSTKQ
jgi:transcription termination factor Rho